MMRISFLLILASLVCFSCSPENEIPEASMIFRKNKQKEWKEKTLSYVDSVNSFIKRGHAEGWDNAGKKPEDPGREHLVKTLISELRRANMEGYVDRFREEWPPAHAPLIPFLEENAQSIPVVCIMDDGSILARIGTNYQTGKTYHINGDQVAETKQSGFWGICPNRRYFGVAEYQGISIHDGWQGPQIAFCPWPLGTEDIPEGLNVSPWEDSPNPSQIIPFPDGKKVLMVSENGIFVLSDSSAKRLLPTREEMREHFEWSKAEHPEDDLSLYLSMEHGAVSKNGRYIAVGSQDSSHLIYNEELELIGDIGNQSSYPHFAVFSNDSDMVAFNSCHFYNGITVGVPTNLLPGLKTEAYEEDNRTPILEDGARVYAAVSRGKEFIIGDASGYIRAFSHKGERLWEQFIGSTVGDIDITPDGKTLVVSTYAGFISIFRMGAGKPAAHQIGTGDHLEERRWIFWKNEPQPLFW